MDDTKRTPHKHKGRAEKGEHEPHKQRVDEDEFDPGASPPRILRRRPVGWEGIPQAGLARAADAARDDALEQLVHRIGLLRWNGAVRVRALFARHPDLPRRLERPFPGVRLSPPQYRHDKVCLVRAEVRLPAVVEELERLTGETHCDRVLRVNTEREIVVIGQGVPAFAQLPDLGFRGHAIAPPPWVGEMRRATGIGHPPVGLETTARGKLIAIQRAREESQQKLEESVRALSLGGRRTVGQVLEAAPALGEHVGEWLSDARRVRTEWSAEKYALVELEVRLSELWGILQRASHVERRQVPIPQPPRRLRPRRTPGGR